MASTPTDMSTPDSTATTEANVRDLAARKGYVLRRAVEGEDRWHIMNPAISSAIYSVSLSNPHSYTLIEAQRVLSTRPDA